MSYLQFLIKFPYLKAVLLLLAALVAVLFCTTYRKSVEKLKNVSSLYEAQNATIEKWENIAGENLARAKAAELNAENISLVLNEELKTLRDEVGSLRRNLISYSKIQAYTGGHFTAPLKDSLIMLNNGEVLEARKVSFSDDFLKFDGLIQNDTLVSSYSIRNDFTYYHYYRRPGKKPFNIFRRKEAVAEIKFKNPHTVADSIYSIVLRREKSGFRKLLGY